MVVDRFFSHVIDRTTVLRRMPLLCTERSMRAALVIIRALALAMVMSVFASPALAQEANPAPDPAFDILEFRVEGNTVLSSRDIERALMPFLGEKRHFADVEGARKALED